MLIVKKQVLCGKGKNKGETRCSPSVLPFYFFTFINVLSGLRRRSRELAPAQVVPYIRHLQSSIRHLLWFVEISCEVCTLQMGRLEAANPSFGGCKRFEFSLQVKDGNFGDAGLPPSKASPFIGGGLKRRGISKRGEPMG